MPNDQHFKGGSYHWNMTNLITQNPIVAIGALRIADAALKRPEEERDEFIESALKKQLGAWGREAIGEGDEIPKTLRVLTYYYIDFPADP